MKHYESYVAESKARRRRQFAVGLVGAVMLATLAVTALMVFNPPAIARAARHREHRMNRHTPSPTVVWPYRPRNTRPAAEPPLRASIGATTASTTWPPAWPARAAISSRPWPRWAHRARADRGD